MSVWGYAAGNIVSAVDTLAIARQGNFIVRSVYAANGAFIPNVRRVQPGDTMRLYYRQRGLLQLLGVYTVQPGNALHQNPAPVAGVPALYQFNYAGVPQPIAALVRVYPVDPHLGVHSGFVVEAAQADQETFAQLKNQRPVYTNHNSLFLIDDGQGFRRAGFHPASGG